MERNEVKIHSRFLADLLNPKGSHGQKDVFLKKFVERFGIETFDTIKTKVDVEFFIGQVTECTGGRMDILIRCEEKVVMIENKIYAIEQPNQLTRDRNYRPNGKLFYLTLNGKESEDKNIDKNDYECISYENDILNWLEECRKESVSIPNLREANTHYINLIKKLTGQNINTKMGEDVANRVIKDRESFKAFSSLVKATDEVRKQMFLQELFPLIGKIAKNHGLETYINKKQLLNNTGPWGAIYFWF